MRAMNRGEAGAMPSAAPRAAVSEQGVPGWPGLTPGHDRDIGEAASARCSGSAVNRLESSFSADLNLGIKLRQAIDGEVSMLGSAMTVL
jgi:hypothetical protein